MALSPSKQDLVAHTLKWVNEVKEGQLSLQQISHIAAVISARDMATIAEGYMEISHETIRSLQYKNKESPDKFKTQIIDTWCKTNPGMNQTKVCSMFFYSESNRFFPFEVNLKFIKLVNAKKGQQWDFTLLTSNNGLQVVKVG